MERNPLDYMPLEAKRLKNMDKSSEEYEFLLEDVFDALSERFDLLSYVKNNNAPEFATINKRSKALVVSSYISIVVSLAAMTMCIITLGEFALSALSTTRIILASATLLVFVVGIITAIAFYKSSQTISIDALEIMVASYTCNDNYSDSMLKMLGTCGMLLGNRIESDTTCGCICCKTVFSSNEIKKYDDESAPICPFCEEPYVVPEKRGIKISDEFLDAANEYWYKKNLEVE